MDQILDLTTKIAEYRELTEKLETTVSLLMMSLHSLHHSMVPAKLVRDWKTLLIAGQPLYPEEGEEEEEVEEGENTSSRLSQSTCSAPPSDLVRESLLDETDFWQYRVGNSYHNRTH